MDLRLAIVIGATLIAVAIAISHRYTISTAPCQLSNGSCSQMWRVNQWTGRVLMCRWDAAYTVCISPEQQ